MRPLLTGLAALSLLASATIFVLFLGHSRRLGGSAMNGGAEHGRYLVGDHGRTTEVTEEEFRTNRLLGIALFSVWPLGMAGGFFLLFTVIVPRMIFLRGEEDRAAAVKRVQRSGEAVATAKVGGRLGWANFGGPLIRVSVHPGGIHLKPLWMPAFAVEKEHIRSVGERKHFLQRRLEIRHDSRDVRSPLLLDARSGTPLAEALEGLGPS